MVNAVAFEVYMGALEYVLTCSASVCRRLQLHNSVQCQDPLSGFIVDFAEVINAVAFEVDMGALGYKLAPDNAVQLAEQPFLQVWEVPTLPIDVITIMYTSISPK